MKPCLLLFLLAPGLMAAPVSWTGPVNGTQAWNNPAHWSTGSVPGPADEVTVAVPGNLQVLLAPGLDVTVARITGTNAFVLDGATLTVTAGASVLNGPVDITSGSLTANNAGTSLVLGGDVTVSGANLAALNGATLAAPGLRNYAGNEVFGASFRLLADGAASFLDLSAVSQLSGPTGRFASLEVTARNGGRVNLPLVSEVTGSTAYFVAVGTNSLLDLTSLTAISRQSLEASRHGSLRCPQLTLAEYSTLSLSDTAELNTDQLTSALGCALIARGGASFAFPALKTYDGGADFGANPVLRAEDPGSRLDLSSITNLVGATGQFATLDINARSGGELLLPNLPELVLGSARTTAEGVGSRIQLDGLTRIERQQLESKNGGKIVNPVLTQSIQATLIVRDTATLNSATLTNLTGSALVATAGAVLTFPLVTTYAGGPSDGQTLLADNPGSAILFPALTHFAGTTAAFRSTGVQARHGGRIEMPLISTIGAGTSHFLSSDPNSRIVLPNLTALLGTTFEAVNGGGFVCPNLVEVSNSALAKRGPDSILPTAGITSFSRNALAASGGATLSFPKLSTHHDGTAPGSWLIESFDAGSLIDFPALTRFDGPRAQFSNVEVRARAGGRVRMPGIIAMGGGSATFTAADANSRIELPNLTSLTGFTLEARSGGSIDSPNLTEVTGSALVQSGEASTLSTGRIGRMIGTSLRATLGARMAFPVLAEYETGNVTGGWTLAATDPGTELEFPILTRFTGARAPFSAVEVRAANGATVAMPRVVALGDGSAGFVAEGPGSGLDMPNLGSLLGFSFTARDSGRIHCPNLTELANTTLYVQGPTAFIPTQQITDIRRTSLFALDGAVLRFPNAHRYDGGTLPGGFRLEAIGAESILDLSQVTDFRGVRTEFSVVSVTARAGGVVSLASVPSFTTGNTWLNADGVGSRIDLVAATSASLVAFDIRNGGSLDTPHLLRIDRSSLNFFGSSNFFPLDQLQALTASTIRINGSTVSFSSLEDVRGSSFDTTGGQAIFPPPANLQVTDIVAPPAAYAGAPITVVWEVTNAAPHSVSGLRHDGLALRRAGTPDVMFGTVEVSNDLPAHTARRYTNSVILPAGLTGVWRLVVSADAGYHVYEGDDEDDNILVDDAPVGLSSPDLVVTAVIPSVTSARFGESFIVNWSVRNQGSTNAPARWDDWVLLSSNPTNLTATIPLGSFPAPRSLDADQTYDQQAVVSVPLLSTLPPADYFIVVLADGRDVQFEANEANNSRATALAFAHPPLPDLAVSQVTAPAEVLPGQPFSIQYTVTNRGPATAVGPWVEQVRIGSTTLATGSSIDPLPPGGSQVRTRNLVMPADFSPAIDGHITVNLDGDDAVVETDETNNSLSAAAPTVVPAGLTLLVPQGSIPESATPPTITGQVIRNGDLAQPLNVALSNTHPARVSVPATLTIPAGQAGAPFPITVLPDGLATGDLPVDIHASAAGRRPATAEVVVVNTDLPALDLEFLSAVVAEGQTASARVIRNGFLDQPLTLTFATGSPGRLLPPGNLTLPPGSTSSVVAFIALDNLVLEPDQTVTASVGAPGFPAASATLTIADNDLPTLGFVLARTNLSEADGPLATTARLHRDRNLNATLLVQLTSSDPDSVQVPETVLFPVGATELEFPVGTVDNTRVDGPRTVTLSAVATHVTTGEPTGPPVLQSLAVADDDGPTLTLTLMRELVGPGLAPATTAIVRRNGGTNTPLTIAVTNSAPDRATIPLSVTLPIGVAETVIPINTTPGAVPGGRLGITLTAGAPGFAPGSDSFILSDLQRPDLIVSQITTPPTALTQAQVSIGWQIRNQGLATTQGQLRQLVYLSRDHNLDADDALIAEQLLDGELPPDLSFTFVRALFLPAEPGDYWIFVRTDSDDAFEETLEDNNLGISAQPIRVAAAYAATSVSVDVVTGGSGQPVEIRGRLIRTGSNQPAPFEPVAIHVFHDGIDRVVGALSDADGWFAATFRSGASEAGFFQVAAGHPAVVSPPIQAQFTLVGFSLEAVTPVNWTLESDTSSGWQLDFGAVGGLPLTDIEASLIDLPSGLVGTTEPLSPVLIPGNTNSVRFAFTSGPTLAGRFQLTLRLTSAEGAQLDVPITLEVRPAESRLMVTPGSLVAGMVRGRQNQVEFAVTNLGSAATGPISLALPALPWLSSATVFPAPSLAPGEGTVFSLLLTPDDALPLTIHSGEIGLLSNGSTVRIPASFRAVSEAVGDLEITAEDEYTYYAAGAPRVAGAHAQLLDPFDHSRVLREIFTGADGVATMIGVPEGIYLLRVTAPKHTRRELRVEIRPGLTQQTQVLLPAETVVYEWTVQPGDVPDSYRFVIDARFEANVPFPVVTADPFLVPLVYPGEITQTSITITNHGLIAAKGIQLRPRSTQTYLITPLFTDVGDLPAHSSITVPVLVQLQPDLDAEFVSRLQQQGRWPQSGSDQPAVFGALESHPARFVDPTTAAARRARPAAGSGGSDCEKPSLDILYFVVCGADGVLHSVAIDLRPVTMLKELKACIEAIAAGAGKGLAGVPKAICDCASSVAAGLGGSVPPELKCLCAFIGLDGGGIAECLCPEIPPGELTYLIGGPGFGAFHPLAVPSGAGGRCQIIPTGGSGPGPSARPASVAAQGTPQPILSQAGEGICATVQLRLEQDLMLTRSAYRANFSLENRLTTPLSELSFVIRFFDRSGRDATSLFGGPPPVLTGLTAIDGTGTLAPATAGSAGFALIPGVEAAPDNATAYLVGGELRYRDASGIVTVTLQPVPIQVLPQPRLLVDYYHQRDVFSDDPHTEEIEPSEPYTLAVLLRNVGRGPANDIRLSSAQPTIIENEKGLLVDFQVVATETFDASGARELTPSLTADFGDLPPGETRVGRWLLKSTLQGLFIDYSARFEHLDGLGQPSLSLVDPDGVRIHELTRLVRDVRTGADALPDFLVNDDFATDPDAIPDSLHFSNGTVEPVSFLTGTPGNAPSVAQPRVELSLLPSPGWTYVRMPDPQGADGPRRFRLARVLRADGFIVPTQNFWQTDRTFTGQGRRPIRENHLHLLDHDSSGQYTLVYEPIPSENRTPPESRVAALPPRVFADFPVAWTAADGGAGTVLFDILVSVDNAPFTPWLKDTALSGAFYPGSPGHHYAFYSIAINAAGNREPAPAAPDATTSSTLTNTPPQLAEIPDQNVIEGDLFSLQVQASDADLPDQELVYQLDSGAPQGLTLNPATGVLLWATGEGNGPSSNTVTVHVRDNGIPSLAASRTFLLVVHETNSAPSLAAIPDAVIREGMTHAFTAMATDPDLPPNRLTYSLAPGAPLGAAVESQSGAFTWTPGNTQGPSTNVLTLVVTDDGLPPLQQARTFTLVVRDTVADFKLRIGRTNLFAGASQSVAVHLQSADNLAALEFQLRTDPDLLTQLQLLPAISGIDSALLQPTGVGTFKASLTFTPEGLAASDDDILRLAFDTPATASGVAPLAPSMVVARDLEGRILRGAGIGGRVVVVGAEPILVAELNPDPELSLFGHPGEAYDIDTAPTLGNTPAWQPWLEGIPLTGEYLVMPLPPFDTQVFLRARSIQ